MVLTFPYWYKFPPRDPVGDIQRPCDGFEDVNDPLPGPVNMWDWDSDGYRWVHTDFVIAIPPESNSLYFITTLQTAKVDVPITVYLYINGSAWLVRMNEHIFRTRSSYRGLFRPYIYNRQRDMFHPIGVSFCQFIRFWFLSGMFPKWIGQYWCWWCII